MDFFGGRQEEKCPDPFQDKVKCEECKCWLDKVDAERVTVLSSFSSHSRWYCQKDKKPYTELTFYGLSYISYYGRVQVLEDGTPVGYKKVK